MAAERPADAWASPFEAAVQRDVENVQTALSTVDRQVLSDVVRALADAGKTLVLGAGSYAAVGYILVDKLNVMGFDARLETRGGIHTVTSMACLGEGDCLVGISFLRQLRHVVIGCQEGVRRGITTVAITDSIFSPLARAASYTLMVPTESTSWFQSLTAATAVVNGLVCELHEYVGTRADASVKSVEGLYDTFDVLYERDPR
jgi:DNA-binding MurR/RpiR family transcriptional regulator